MGKKLFFKFSIILLLINADNVLANETVCPQREQVINTIFKYAYSTGNNWRLAADPFLFEGKSWNVEFEVNLPSAKDAAEALSQGQALFSQLPLKPLPSSQCNIQCRYDTNFGKYIISARPEASF